MVAMTAWARAYDGGDTTRVGLLAGLTIEAIVRVDASELVHFARGVALVVIHATNAPPVVLRSA